jgi:hypothetical protein
LSSAERVSKSTSAKEVVAQERFVQVMGLVWKRPGLTLIEAAWRWTFGILALTLLLHRGAGVLDRVYQTGGVLGGVDLGQLTITQPGAAAGGLAKACATAWPPVFAVLLHLAPWLLVLRVALNVVGDAWLLRRLDASTCTRVRTLFAAFVLHLLRLLALSALVLLWGSIGVWACHHFITLPMAQGSDANLIGYCALLVVATLVAFVLWSFTGWTLNAAPLLALERGIGIAASLRGTLHLGKVRSKLAEINLVMGIARVALIVLALVFSSCPLPFSEIATQTFLLNWWIGVGVWYLVASEYFQAVRVAAYWALSRREKVSAEPR